MSIEHSKLSSEPSNIEVSELSDLLSPEDNEDRFSNSGIFFFNNTPFEIHLLRENLEEIPGQVYEFIVQRGNSTVNLKVLIEPINGYYLVNDTLLKTNPDKELPDGIGMQLYNLVSQFIQHLAARDNVLYRHSMLKFRGISENPMSDERWHELFNPIIEKLKYTQINDNRYVRDYIPV